MNGKTAGIFYKLASKILNMIYKIVNREVNVPYLQKKYKATRGTILEICVTHTPNPTKPPVARVSKYFKIENGKAIMLDEAEPNATVWCELDTMLNMIKGEVEREYQGRKWKEGYTPLDAWAEGRLTVESPRKRESGWLSDLELLSREIYSQVFPILKKEIGDKLP